MFKPVTRNSWTGTIQPTAAITEVDHGSLVEDENISEAVLQDLSRRIPVTSLNPYLLIQLDEITAEPETITIEPYGISKSSTSVYLVVTESNHPNLFQMLSSAAYRMTGLNMNSKLVQVDYGAGFGRPIRVNKTPGWEGRK